MDEKKTEAGSAGEKSCGCGSSGCGGGSCGSGCGGHHRGGKGVILVLFFLVGGIIGYLIGMNTGMRHHAMMMGMMEHGHSMMMGEPSATAPSEK